MLREVTATRYVEPLRAGGSVPGVVEADDLGTYVVKFTGSAQGRKALVAEIIVGELARRLGLRFPELVLVDFDPAVAADEPHQEVQDLLHASAGVNLGMDLLPGAADFTPEALDVDPLEAGKVVWLDALTANVDRTVHSSNLMIWPTFGIHQPRLWLIDHGAALVFHHRWGATAPDKALRLPPPRPRRVRAGHGRRRRRTGAPRHGGGCCARSPPSCRTRGWRTSRGSRRPTRCGRRTLTSCWPARGPRRPGCRWTSPVAG